MNALRLRTKIFICTAITTLALMAGVFYFFERKLEWLITDSLDYAGTVFSSTIADFSPSLLSRKGYDDLFYFVENTMANAPVVEEISILDRNYRFVAHRERAGMKTRIGETMPEQERRKFDVSARGVFKIADPEKPYAEYYSPIIHEDIFMGLTIEKISYRPIEELRRDIGSWFFALIAGVIALSTAMSFGVSNAITANLRKLMEGVKVVSDGDLSHRIAIDSKDEIGELADQFNRMLFGLQERMQLARFVPENLFEVIKKDTGSIEMGGHEKDVTVLFADIRGFTTLSERHPAREMVEMLNEYLERMTAVIKSQGGVVDKFIGDAIMAVFYPGEHADDTTRAVIAGMQMMEELRRFNHRRMALDLFTIEIGVGINAGSAIVGMIGSKSGRLDYTVIGDTVNLASRLEGMSKLGKHTKIVLSEIAHERVARIFEAELMEADRVKGKEEQVRMFEVLGVKPTEKILSEIGAMNDYDRIQAVNLLGLSGHPGMSDVLLKYLRDPSPEVRMTAGVALKNLLRPISVVVDHFITAIADERDTRVIATYINDIGSLGSDRDIIKLVPFLEHENERVRANVVEAVSRVRDKSLVHDMLAAKLTDPNNRTRANAAIALYRTGDLAGLRTLIGMCHDAGSHLMRASGAYGIGQVASKKTAQNIFLYLSFDGFVMSEERFTLLENARIELEKLLSDENTIVKNNAIRALGHMGSSNSIPALIREYRKQPEHGQHKKMLLSSITEISGSYIPDIVAGQAEPGGTKS